MAQCNDVIAAVAKIAPLELAADWDNVGILVGPKRETVERIMTCLTVTPVTAQEAVDKRADLIIVHHPIIFRAIKSLSAHDSASRVLLQLIQAGVAVYSAHTAYDNAPGGINDLLADAIGLSKPVPLRPLESRCKLAVFVPEEAVPAVSDALFEAGAGQIGRYRECSYRSPGTGTFFGDESTSPFVGRRGQREAVAEYRLEVVCPKAQLGEALAALKRSHPYEEPAYDIYPLIGSAGGSNGEGRCAELVPPQSVGEIADRLKKFLGIRHVDLVGDAASVAHRAAIVCGSGGELTIDAVNHRANVLITGELKFHDALLAEANQLAVILLGHYTSERFAMKKMADLLAAQFPQVSVWASTEERDPITRS
jgi:dinuclear metal center YbgI/SA1388 family protein